MRFRISLVHSNSNRHAVFMSDKSASSLGIFFGDVIELTQDKKKVSAVVLESNLPEGNIGLTRYFIYTASLDLNQYVEAELERKAGSINLILKKLRGLPLSREEINLIVKDISRQALSEAAISYFVAAVAKNGLSLSETRHLTESMANSGDRLHWNSKVVADKHCVGGIPGNRTTPIVVAICAAAGLIMPKTSSRAITSAAGTADMMEVLTHVALPTTKIKSVVQKVGACLAWGGSLGLAPADDLLIHVERQIDLDPKEQIVASILSKKIAAGSTHVLIDIPVGKGAKVSIKEGKELSSLFKKVALQFNLIVETVLTDGTQPIGQGIGPLLEARDVLAVLEGKDVSPDLREKSIFLAGKLLELTGKVKKGKGEEQAKYYLDSGAALKKFNEILDAQGRKKVDLTPGPYSFDLFASGGKRLVWNNQELNHLARVLGCPEKNKAGLLLHVLSHMKAKQEKPIITLYAETQNELEEAKEFIKSNSLFTFK
jgi:thymidine phosphorylase